MHKRVNKPNPSWSSPFQAKTSRFASPQVHAQPSSNSSLPLSPAQIEQMENESFNQHKFEATVLQIQAKYGTITPEGQERLNILQAKMDATWETRLAKINNSTNLLQRLIDKDVAPTTEPPAPIQPKLTVDKPEDVAAPGVNPTHAPEAQPSPPGESLQRQEMPQAEQELQHESLEQSEKWESNPTQQKHFANGATPPQPPAAPQIQRQANQGNTAVTATSANPLVVQRDGDEAQDKSKKGDWKADAEVNTPGTKLEYDYEFKQVGHHSGHIKVGIEPKGSKLVEGKAGYEGADKDNNGDADSSIGVGGKLLENEAILKRSGGKMAKELASSLGAVEAGASPFEWLTVKLEGKLFEGNYDWQEGETNLDLAKVAVGVEGTVPKEWVSQFFPKSLAEHLEIKIAGEYEYAIPFSDLAKLKRMHQAGEEIIQHSEELLKKEDELAKLAKRRAEVQKSLQSGGDFHAYGKKTKQKLAEQGIHSKEEFLKRKKALKAELAKLSQDIDKLDDGIKKHKGVIKKAQQALTKAANGLKSKTGKLVSTALRTAGGKILAKIGTKLVPGVNFITTALDIIEVSSKIYDLATGKAKFGFGGDGDGGGKSEEGESSGSGETSGEGGAGGSDASGGVEVGTEGETTDAGGTGTGGVSDSGLYGEVQDPYESPPQLSPNAQKVLEAIKTDSETGLKLSPDDLRLFNDVIPEDLTPEQLDEVLRRLHENKKGNATDVDEVIGQIMQTVQNVQTGQQDGEKSATVNGEDITDQVYGDGSTDNQPTETAKIDFNQAMQFNPIEQRILGWTVAELTKGESWSANSKEFVDWVANYQHQKGIKEDGIAGPVTTSTRYEELGLTDSPIYKKAQDELARRVKNAGQKRGKADETDGNNEGTGKKGGVTGDKGKDADQGLKQNRGGGTGKENQDEAPRELLPEGVPCISQDEVTGKYFRDQKQIKAFEGRLYTHDDGLKVKILHIDVSISETNDQNSIQLIYINVDVEVAGLPVGAGADYPFQLNQKDTVSWSFWSNPKTKKAGELVDSGLDSTLGAVLAVAPNGQLVIPPNIKGKSLDLGDVHAKVTQIVSQTSTPRDDGNTSYQVVLEIVPTQLKQSESIIRGSQRQFFVVGQPMNITITTHRSSKDGK